jgi:hypothetical protein
MDSRWINFKKNMTCATSTFTTLLTGKNKNPTKVADRLGQDVFTIMKYPNSSNHSIQFFWIPYRPKSQSCLVSPWNQKKYCSIKDSVQLRLGLGFHTQSRRFRATGKFKNRCETRGANMFGYDWSILSVAVTCYTLSYNGFSTMSNMLQCLCMIGHVGIIKHYVFGYSIVTQSYMIAG